MMRIAAKHWVDAWDRKEAALKRLMSVSGDNATPTHEEEANFVNAWNALNDAVEVVGPNGEPAKSIGTKYELRFIMSNKRPPPAPTPEELPGVGPRDVVPIMGGRFQILRADWGKARKLVAKGAQIGDWGADQWMRGMDLATHARPARGDWATFPQIAQLPPCPEGRDPEAWEMNGIATELAPLLERAYREDR